MTENGSGRVRGFGLRWVLLCGLGFGAGLAAGLGLAAPVEAVVGMMLVTPVVLAIAGSMFGAGQWLAIRRNVRAGALWIGASAIGLGIGMTVGIVLVETMGRVLAGEAVRLFSVGPVGRFVGLLLVGLVAGLGVGAAQWLALRARARLTWRWVLWCGLGFGAGLPGGGLAADLLPGGLQSVGGFATFLGVAGLIVGGLTVRGAVTIAAGLRVRRAA